VGYQGGRLADLFSQEPVNRALSDMALAGGSAMWEVTRDRTPVHTGEVRDSWIVKPVRHERIGGTDGYESGVESNHYRARWVEHGVNAHPERPKHRRAELTPEGPRAAVDHPGFPGAHPVASAAAWAEANFERITSPVAERWARETERLAKTHDGIR
jgi:hypothetical protein